MRSSRHFLVSLGVPAAIAQADAEGMEHHVSRQTLAAFIKHLKKSGAPPGGLARDGIDLGGTLSFVPPGRQFSLVSRFLGRTDSVAMSRSFARIVLAVSLVFFAAFFCGRSGRFSRVDSSMPMAGSRSLSWERCSAIRSISAA